MAKECAVTSCNRAARARGYCSGHYLRVRRYGDPQANIPLKGKARGCSVSGCGREHYAFGYCNPHSRRFKETGSVDEATPVEERSATPDDALRDKTSAQAGGCIIWTGYLNHRGYGMIAVGGHRDEPAHRYSWKKEHGEIPDGMVVDHTCYNRACVNVDHLRLATPQQNQSNRSGPTRDNRASGVRNVYPVGNKWGVYITKNNKPNYYGVYATVEEAASVAEAKRAELFGEYAGRG